MRPGINKVPGRFLFLGWLGQVCLNSFEGFVTYNMLDPAGIFSGSLRTYADIGKELTYDNMPLIYLLCYLKSGVRKGDVALLVDCNISGVAKESHRAGDAGL